MKKIITILMIAILILSYEKVNASEIATNSLLPAGVTYYEAFGTARPGTLNEQVINSNYYVGFSQASPITIVRKKEPTVQSKTFFITKPPS